MFNAKRCKSASLISNLRFLCTLRLILIAIWIIACAAAWAGLGMALPTVPLGAVLALWTLLGLATYRRLDLLRWVSESELFIQLLVDVAALTALLYYSGGATNPLISLYLLPLVAAATALPQGYAWAVAGITASVYTLLLFYFLPLPYGEHGFSLHVIGMWLTFVLSAALIAYFMVRMARALREQDQHLALAREQALRDQQVLALGTLAAGTAHELSTPLATIAVLARELEKEYGHNPSLGEDLHTLRTQVEVCKGILSDLAACAGQARGEGGGRQTLDRFLKGILERWQLLHPGVKATWRWTGTQPTPCIVAEQSLSQVLISLLNNAADASPEGVELEGRWTSEELTLEICDRGVGLPPLVARRAGEAGFTTKAEGLGLGLFLARAVLERFGGQVTMTNQPEGGTCTRIILPLSPLIAL